jgi:hypothetical protein
MLLEFEPIHLGHANIDDQKANGKRRSGFQELQCRGEASYWKGLGFEQH